KSTLDRDGNYVVSGRKNGLVTVTAIGAVDSTKTQSFSLYVNTDEYECKFQIDTTAAKADRKMNDANVILGKYDEIPLGIISLGENGGIPIVTWSISSGEEYASIDAKTGVMKTNSASGGKTITVKAVSGIYEDTLECTIKEVRATGITTISENVASGATAQVTESKEGANAGATKVGCKFQLKATEYTPLNANYTKGDITWSSSDPEVATIDAKGNVTALTKGTTIITAKYTDGESSSQTYTLSVDGDTVLVTAINADQKLVIPNNTGKAITASVVPQNASNKSLTYTSSDEDIAQVTSAGYVTAKKVGTCTITIKANDGSGVKTEVAIEVTGSDATDVNKPDTTTQAPAATTQAPAAPTTTTVAAPTTEAPAAVTAPAKVKISSAKNVKGKKLIIKFKKIAGVKTYQIVYSLKKNFKGKKTINTTKTSYTIKKLKKGKTYYVKVRAKNAAGFGKFSAVKKVKIKK
ncbi:MAG: Ig-like domain-containing protein, partial [Lachnospiraceae bacterium]|nr:Ig-like domain-containing protein [Lachnospiraceae bacterium]